MAGGVLKAQSAGLQLRVYALDIDVGRKDDDGKIGDFRAAEFPFMGIVAGAGTRLA